MYTRTVSSMSPMSLLGKRFFVQIDGSSNISNIPHKESLYTGSTLQILDLSRELQVFQSMSSLGGKSNIR